MIAPMVGITWIDSSLVTGLPDLGGTFAHTSLAGYVTKRDLSALVHSS